MSDSTDNRYEAERRLAFGYFDGTISDDGERRLFDFIRQHDPNRRMLGEWEREWMESGDVSAATEAEWQRLSRRVRMQDLRRRRAGMLRRVGKWVAAAVVIAVVFVIGGMAGRGTVSEVYFSSSAPLGSTAETVLPDGSRVLLNAGSSIRYSSRFNESNRHVVLNGEGYFEVTHHDGVKFVVETDGYEVEVRGTKFYVSAYPGDKYVSTTLVKGSVAVNYRDTCYMLKPGERAVLNRSTGVLECSYVSKPSSGWQCGYIDCDDIALGDLCRIIERRYGVRIYVESRELASRRLYISLHNNETVDEVLAALKRTLGVNVSRNGRNVRIGQ